MKNERPARASAAAIAERILAAEPWDLAEFSWEEMRALAEFVATHAHDHAEHEIIRKGELPEGHRLVKRHEEIARNGKVRT